MKRSLMLGGKASKKDSSSFPLVNQVWRVEVQVYATLVTSESVHTIGNSGVHAKPWKTWDYGEQQQVIRRCWGG